MTAWIIYKKDKPASFFSLTGLGLGGVGIPSGGTGASFNTGRINRINGDIGHLLAMILK